MPIPRVQVEFTPRSPGNLVAATVIINNIAGSSFLDKPKDFQDDNLKVLHVRYEIPVEGRNVYENLKSSNQLAALVIGKISYHLCSHDDADVFNCKTDPRAEYEESIL